MSIKKMVDGKRYCIFYDGNQSRDYIRSDNIIAIFDNLYDASLVLRFLKGCNMSKNDVEYAKRCIKESDNRRNKKVRAKENKHDE